MRKNHNIYHPRLKFRYWVEFMNYPDFKTPYYTGNTVTLPHWTLKDGWGNMLEFTFYNFEMPNALENDLIEIIKTPLNRKFRINFLHPDGETIIGYWEIVGNIEVCDFGNASWKSDDVLEVSIKILPIHCEYVNLITE